MDAETKGVVSCGTLSCTPPGIRFCNNVSCARTAFSTGSAFAPLASMMPIAAAGLPFRGFT